MTKSEVINTIDPRETIKYPAPNQEIIDGKTKLRSFSAIVATFAIVLTLGGTTAQGACSVPTGPYPTIQSAVDDGSCAIINVAAGAYVESVTIPRSLILNGAKAGNSVAGRTPGPGESNVTGLGAPVITINAPNVTIDGFSLTNPLQSTGILIKTLGDSAFITNNIIDTIGGAGFAGNTQGIYLEHGPDNVRVVNNRISRVQGVASSNGGVFIGDSTATNPSVNTLISGNSIEFITSSARGAYAIHVNNGVGSTANSGLVITNNTISNLTGGGWVHAIGLEGDTPGVRVRDNSLSNFVTGPNSVAVWFEDNPSFATGHVNQNNFNVTAAAFGIAVHPILPPGPVDGTCNWWNDPNGPGPVGPGAGAKVSLKVDFTPWLTAPAPGGPCGGGSTPGKATGGGQIPGEDPIFSPLGVLLSLPALVVSAGGPNEKATFGFVAKCCAPTGNLEYNDHGADVRIKAQSIDGLVISSPGVSCPVPGTKHATFTGMAQVIRSTGTTNEPFTVDVDDCGEPGTRDTFGIKTTTYSNGPSTLIGGNIQIH